MPEVLAGKRQGHVYAGATEEPSDVNPLTASCAVAQILILGVTHDALLDRDSRTGALRNALAEHYELSSDGKACTFTLRQGNLFGDGAPLTMADVLFGWELAHAGHLPMGFVRKAFARITKAEALDDVRLRVHFAKPNFRAASPVGEAWLVCQKAFFVERVRHRLRADEAMPDVS